MDDGDELEKVAAMIYFYTGNNPDLMNDADFAKAYGRVEYMMRITGLKKK